MTDKPFIEYTIIVKDENTRLAEKEISYEPIFLSKENIDLQEKVSKVVNKFKGNSGNESPSVVVKMTMIWQI